MVAYLQARELPDDVVLPVLRATSEDVTWQYLEHLVNVRNSPVAAHRTELALLLIAAAQHILPVPDPRCVVCLNLRSFK